MRPRPAAHTTATVGPHPWTQLAVGRRRARVTEAARQRQRRAPPARDGARVGVGGREGGGCAYTAPLAALAVRTGRMANGGVQRCSDPAVWLGLGLGLRLGLGLEGWG